LIVLAFVGELGFFQFETVGEIDQTELVLFGSLPENMSWFDVVMGYTRLPELVVEVHHIETGYQYSTFED
jgi:hypothetical protein